jgi:DNA-directed RNA polymerase specialized sigma24 family protein
VLVLAAGEGLRNQEIAERLGMSAKAVERVLARALVRLDRALERQERPWWRIW